RKRCNIKLVKLKKMDSIGNLAGGVAHDFNNMLGGISGIVSLLEMKETEYDKIELLHAITKAVNRSSELTKKLLAFGRKGKNLNKPVNVNDTINDVISIIGNTISKNIAINMNLSESLNFIDADPNQINQVILNLCVNAAESIEDNIGKINITTENIILDEDFFDTHPEHKLGDYVKITVEDTGYGMDKETQRKIYEPFFTTKIDGQVKGTGLGLATVYGIIINHKGIIDLKSKVDEGSKFEIYFPKGKKVPKKVSENKSEIKLKSVKESLILIIEDDEINRRMLVEMFKILGHKVLVASNGVEGVKIYQERFADIDLVFMDMAIPLMEEKSAYLKMKKINSQIKSVLVTDYSHDEDVQEILDLGVNTLLLKPFELSSVQRALEENL
ncbi:MAG: ATP-binding protein, partial [Candidatus Cloacimonadota bacterium]|nr:ATP-binding protein [Candidatus Cloacimonadota bacterium]